jgi:hypothetical protein
LASLPSLKHLRDKRRKPQYSVEQECDLINHNNINQQHELTIREDECSNQDNDTKSVTYCDWLKSLINCR